MKTTYSLFGIVVLSALQGCLAPRPHFAEELSLIDLKRTVESDPLRQIKYCGSDSSFHHFVHWRFAAGIGVPITRSSYLEKFKVPKSNVAIENEIPRTQNMDNWKYLSEIGIELE